MYETPGFFFMDLAIYCLTNTPVYEVRSRLKALQFFSCLTTEERQANTSCNHNVDLAAQVYPSRGLSMLLLKSNFLVTCTLYDLSVVRAHFNRSFVRK